MLKDQLEIQIEEQKALFEEKLKNQRKDLLQVMDDSVKSTKEKFENQFSETHSSVTHVQIELQNLADRTKKTDAEIFMIQEQLAANLKKVRDNLMGVIDKTDFNQ